MEKRICQQCWVVILTTQHWGGEASSPESELLQLTLCVLRYIGIPFHAGHHGS